MAVPNFMSKAFSYHIVPPLPLGHDQIKKKPGADRVNWFVIVLFDKLVDKI